jgi:hypothetical protein
VSVIGNRDKAARRQTQAAAAPTTVLKSAARVEALGPLRDAFYNISSSGLNGRWSPRVPSAPTAYTNKQLVAAGRVAAHLNLITVKLPRWRKTILRFISTQKVSEQLDLIIIVLNFAFLM